MPALPIKRRAAVALVGIAMGYWLIGMLSQLEGSSFGPTHLGDVAHQHFSRNVWLVMALLMVIPLTIGLLIGRPLARLMVRALLPPRLRSALAGLWLIDGLDPPRTVVPRGLRKSR